MVIKIRVLLDLANRDASREWIKLQNAVHITFKKALLLGLLVAIVLIDNGEVFATIATTRKPTTRNNC
jgi:hypothetical protein